MDLNTKVKSRIECSSIMNDVSEKSDAGNSNGMSVTSVPGTSAEGLSVYSNQAGASGDTPPNIDERKVSSAFSDNDTIINMEPPKENEPEQAKYKLPKFEQKINDSETETIQKDDENREPNKNDEAPTPRKNIYEIIANEADVDVDVDLGDYIEFPDVKKYEDLMSNELYEEIKSQFLKDINLLKGLVHFFVDDQYDDRISTFYNNIEENHEGFHIAFFLLYKETRCHLRCLTVKLEIAQGNHILKDYIASVLNNCLEAIDLCPAGVHARFMGSYINLDASAEGLNRKLLRVRSELFKQCILSFIAERQRIDNIAISGEIDIHGYTALNNFSCESISLPVIVDEFATNNLGPALTNDFADYVKLAVSKSAIIRKLKNDWSDDIYSILEKEGALEWITRDMNYSEIRQEIIALFDSRIFGPINSFMGKKKHDKLAIRDLIEVEFGVIYRFKNYRENFFLWLTSNFCVSKDDHKSKSKITVFSALPALPGTTSPSLYIGTVEGVFFWVFNDEKSLKEEQACKFNAGNRITLDLSHLASIDFSNKSEELLYALLSQAMEQTNKAEDIASFFFDPAINEQLGKKTHWLMKSLCNQLTEMLTHKDSNFKTELCEKIANKVARSNEKSLSKEAVAWLSDSLLLEKVLLNLNTLNIDIMLMTQSLSIADISCFSEESLNKLLTSEDCQRLFKQAFTLKRAAIALCLLLTKKCDPLIAISISEKANTLSFFADHKIVLGVEYLLDNGLVDIHGTDSLGRTPLIAIAKAGYEHCLKVLLDKGANVNAINHKGYTPLHEAIRYKHLGCFQLLLETEDIQVDEKDNSGLTPLGYSILLSRVEYFNALLKFDNIKVKIANNGYDHMICEAASQKSTVFLNALLTENNVNRLDEYGRTPLHAATCIGSTEECFKILLNYANVKLNAKNKYGQTPLHLTARNGKKACFKMLLRHRDIDVNIKDNYGRTPLITALENGCIECANALLDVSETLLNVIVSYGFGSTALYVAVSNDKLNAIVNRLLMDKRDVSFKEKNRLGDTLLHQASLENAKENLNTLLRVKDIRAQVFMKNGAANTPLHCAAMMGSTESTSILLNVEGIEVNAQDNYDETPLHYAAKKGKIGCLNALLGAKGIQVNAKDSEGRTPLHYAAELGNLVCLNALLGAKGIQVNAKDVNGATPFDLATEHDHFACANACASASANALGEVIEPSLLRRMMTFIGMPMVFTVPGIWGAMLRFFTWVTRLRDAI